MRLRRHSPEPCWTIRLTYPLAQHNYRLSLLYALLSGFFHPRLILLYGGLFQIAPWLTHSELARRRPQLASEHTEHFCRSLQIQPESKLNIQCIKKPKRRLQQSLSCAGVFDLIVMQPDLPSRFPLQSQSRFVWPLNATLWPNACISSNSSANSPTRILLVTGLLPQSHSRQG